MVELPQSPETHGLKVFLLNFCVSGLLRTELDRSEKAFRKELGVPNSLNG